MRFITLVEVAQGAEAHKESWKQFGEIVFVWRNEKQKLCDELNHLAAPIPGPAWVALAELNEEFQGDASRAHYDLELFVNRLLQAQAQISASARFVGADFSNTRVYRPKLWYVPEGSTFGKEWEFRFEVDVVVTSRRPTLDSLLFGLNPEGFAIARRTSIRGPGEVARRQAIIEAVPPPLFLAEQQHYALAALPEWSPLLSLCVLARGVDESLIRMLESARGHFSEVVILLTRSGIPTEGIPSLDAAAVVAAREALVGVVTVPLVIDVWHDPDSFQLKDGMWCIGNFDHARQRCFELASGMFRMFLDSDDTFEWLLGGPRPQLWDIVQKNFMADTSIAFPYFYVPESPLGDAAAPGLSQPRNALFRWLDERGNPLWRWHRPLHERAVPTEWNAVAKHKNSCVDAGFVIKHHGSAEAGSHRERNAHIARHALEHRSDLSPIDRAALEYVLATIAKDEVGLTAAESLYKDAMRHGAGDSYGLVAAIDYAGALVAAHRGAEVPPLILPPLEGSPGDPALQLALARSYRSVGQPYLALKWYWEVFRPDRPEAPAGAEYRSVYVDEQFLGRLEAAEVAVEANALGPAEKMLASAPSAVLARPELRFAITDIKRRQGDVQAAQAALTLTHYLLSLDCVDLAVDVVEALTPQLLAQPHVVRAQRMVERRTRHLRNDQAYLATYDMLNEADLVVKSKPHQKFLFERIVLASPKTFIDVGCNTAWLTINVAKALPAGRCIGLDISPARVEEAQRRAALEGVENIEFYVDGALPEGDTLLETLRHVPGVSALVLISEVLEHLSNSEAVLAFWSCRASRIMITVPDVEAYFNLWPWARQLDAPLEKSERLGSDGAEHVRCYDAHRLVEHLQAAEFEPARVERIDISTNLAGEKENDQSLLFADAKYAARQYAPQRRIDIHCEGWVPWGPRAHLEGSGPSRMVGGSEQAVIHLAPELAALGYEVHVYAKPMDRREYERGVWWHPLGEFVACEPRSLVIVWRRAEHLYKCVTEAAGRWPVWLWCHDVPAQNRAQDYRLADRVVVLSEYQQGIFLQLGVPEASLVVLQNGIVEEAIQLALNCTDVADNLRDPHAVFYGSSGDRGLLHLLRAWPSIRDAVPDARLFATYRTDLMRWPTNGPTWFKIADEIESLGATSPGVTFYPGLPHDEYLAAAARCGVWAYPSNFEEISCIVAMEMQALGLEPVVDDLAALKETVLDGPLVSWEVVRRELIVGGAEVRDGTFWVPDGCFSKTFRDVLVDALERPMCNEDRVKLSKEAIARYSWTRTARLFAAAIEESTNEPQSDEEPRR